MVILDLGLPDMDGRNLSYAYVIGSKQPILVLSVRSDEAEKVEALDAGANDYVTKPFGISDSWQGSGSCYECMVKAKRLMSRFS